MSVRLRVHASEHVYICVRVDVIASDSPWQCLRRRQRERQRFYWYSVRVGGGCSSTYTL